MSNEIDVWPAGATWVFQGTVQEDATAGTHVCTLTVTPGAGNEMKILGGSIVVGSTSTAQVKTIDVDDGANSIVRPVAANSTTDANRRMSFGAGAGNAVTTYNNDFVPLDLVVSGTMRLILTVSTTAVSVTQTFAVACRIKGAIPIATLADTVGTPTLTTNTSRVF